MKEFRMKAQCPTCGYVHNINDSKIPDKGIYGLCRNCRNRFFIKKEFPKEAVLMTEYSIPNAPEEDMPLPELQNLPDEETSVSDSVLREVKRQQFAAAFFDFFIVNSVFQALMGIIYAVGSYKLSGLMNFIGTLLVFLLVLSYHLFVTWEIHFRSPGEYITGCRIIENKKRWISVFSRSRWFLFIVLLILLYYPPAAFNVMEKTGGWKLLTALGRVVSVGVFITSVWYIALGYFKWSVPVYLILCVHMAAVLLIPMPVRELVFVTIERNLFLMTLLTVALLIYDKSRLLVNQEGETDEQKPRTKKMKWAATILAYFLIGIFLGLNGWNIYWYYEGSQWLKKGNPALAIECYTRALITKPHDDDAYYKRGEAFAEKGDTDRAIEDYTKSIKIHPGDEAVYYHRGNAFAEKGDTDQAIRDYTRALEIKPKYTDAYIDRGIAWKKKNDLTRAIADFTDAIKINPNDIRAYVERGKILMEKQEFERAIEDFNDALQINPFDPDIYYQRGVVWKNQGDSEKAENDFNKSEVLRSQ
jgi:tetratricopeptide (TPR) repeat protein